MDAAMEARAFISSTDEQQGELSVLRRPCRVCRSGPSPLCESYIAKEQLNSMEPFYPLAAYVCRGCVLVQLQEFVTPEDIFSEYAYFSSYSDAWLDHARRYVET